MTDDPHEQFTNTELAIISLVLAQNAEKYGHDEETVRNVHRISTKARELMDDSTND